MVEAAVDHWTAQYLTYKNELDDDPNGCIEEQPGLAEDKKFYSFPQLGIKGRQIGTEQFDDNDKPAPSSAYSVDQQVFWLVWRSAVKKEYYDKKVREYERIKDQMRKAG